MIRILRTIVFLMAMLLFASCGLTKYVPEGDYLLNRVEVKSDNGKLDVAELEDLVQQRPNKKSAFFGRVGLRFYSLSGRDTTKWRNRMIRKMGDPPVIFNP